MGEQLLGEWAIVGVNISSIHVNCRRFTTVTSNAGSKNREGKESNTRPPTPSNPVELGLHNVPLEYKTHAFYPKNKPGSSAHRTCMASCGFEIVPST